MLHCDLSQKEQHRRKEIAEHTRQMLLAELPIDSQDETSIMGRYRDYYLQISFSELHPSGYRKTVPDRKRSESEKRARKSCDQRRSRLLFLPCHTLAGYRVGCQAILRNP